MASDLAESHISQLLEAAVEAARIAGPYFISGFRDRSALADSIETKSSATDLVTASDKLCEKVIVEHLSAKFPNHAFIGEEGTGGTWPEDDTPVWIIDPIDGTTNFVSGLEPFTCISIGCAIRKQPVVGVVYAPLVDQLYSAALGRGAFLNGTTKLPIFDHFPPLSLSSALVVTEFGHSPAPEIQKPKQEAIARLVGNCRGIRSFGSCAMNMCTVSKGGCDAYYEKGIHCWDVAAAYVILTEAGGMVVNYKSADDFKYDICARDVICVRGGRQDAQEATIAELRKVLQESGAFIEGQYERD